MNQPKIVGVTGGIGSGKSLICSILEIIGHKVYYADKRGRWLTNNKKQVVEAVSLLFGTNIYVNNELDRKKVAQLVFNDKKKLQKLNAIIHPAVKQDFSDWVEQNKSEKFLFKESALLFETEDFKLVDYSLLVTASEEIRIERVLKRDQHRTPESIKNIIENQMPDAEKIKLAHFVINNSGQESVIQQTMKILTQMNNI